jgi:hypothetical protein
LGVPRLDKLTYSSFFNFDSLAWQLHSNRFQYDGFLSAIDSGKLDIMAASLHAETSDYHVFRALWLYEQYGFSFSEQLTTYIHYWKSTTSHPHKQLRAAEEKHYGYKRLRESTLREVLEQL